MGLVPKDIDVLEVEEGGAKGEEVEGVLATE